MGKIISVTIPLPLVEHLQKEAEIVGISRSRFISNILLKWQEDQKLIKDPKKRNESNSVESVPNICEHRRKDGFCKFFEITCNAPQSETETCPGYFKDIGDKEI